MLPATLEEKGWMLEIFFHKALDSTQLEARRLVQNGISRPFAVVSDIQHKGMGSRNNQWHSQEGNLFLSFVLERKLLPLDLPLSSASIYFGYLLKETLDGYGSAAWLKWPNDLYLDENKIGGVITQVVGENLICGIGLNLLRSEFFHGLDVKIDRNDLIKTYFFKLEKFPEWKKIFSKFRIEFFKSKGAVAHVDGEKLSLENALLQDDGSLIINGKRVFSLR